jgi:HK97 family phage major capsid protein
MYDAGRMRQECRIVQSTEGASMRMKMQDAASTSTWEGETDVIAAGEPTVEAAINLRLKKHANLSTLSNELLADVFGVAAWLVSDVAGQMAEQEDIKLYRDGAGGDEPNGFELADATATAGPAYYVKAGAAQAADNEAIGVLTLNLLNRMFYALPEKERGSAIWTGSSVLATMLSDLIDAQGRPVLRRQDQEAGVVGDSIAGAQTTTILGRRFVEMPGKIGVAGADTNRLYFSNMQRSYVMLVKGGLQVAASGEAGTAFSTDSTVFRFTQRLDGDTFNNPIPARPQYVYTGHLESVA